MPTRACISPTGPHAAVDSVLPIRRSAERWPIQRNRPTPTIRQPSETVDQARTWDKVKNHARAFGLCHACASQIAWGHQLGFRETTREPCGGCVALIATLPVRKANGWRTVQGRAVTAASWPHNPHRGIPASSGPSRSTPSRGPLQTSEVQA